MIKEISSEETLLLRQKVLREGLELEFCRFDGDDLKNTFHLGYFSNNQIIGIISCMMSCQNQIRGMAIEPSMQGQRIGSALLEKAIGILKTKNQTSTWCNARINAASFYKRHSFFIEGDSFLIEGVGEHFKMLRSL